MSEPGTAPARVDVGLRAPRAGLLAAWGSAWLGGRVGFDDVLAQVVGDATTSVVEGDGTPADALSAGAAATLGGWLAGLRPAGVRRLHAVLPASGDALGLPGPSALNLAALAVGEAVLTEGGRPQALVPAPGDGDRPEADRAGLLRWLRFDAARQPDGPAQLAEAEHGLGEALREATRELATLDVARCTPETARALAELRDAARRDTGDILPPGFPPRAARLLALAQRLTGVVALGRADPGGTASSYEARGRDDALRSLGGAVRRATAVAYSSYGTD